MITVFTPTYNRKDKLSDLYESLLNQNNSSFEWLIVDDGSVDGTMDYVSNIKNENRIIINYFYKDNGGKQSAYNFALNHFNGDIFLCIDSDDVLKENILEGIEKDFKNLSEEIGGIMYNQGYINEKNKVIGTVFPTDSLIDNYFNVYHKHHVLGDKLIVLKRNVAKEYYFPEFKGERFVPEALIFNRIALKYKFLCLNKIAAYKEYLEDGYSNNYFELVKKNPKGNALYFLELYNMEQSLYNIYGYLLFSIYGKEKFKSILKHPNKIMCLLFYFPVLLVAKIRR